MQQQIAAIAKQFNIDKNALVGLMEYLKRALDKNPDVARGIANGTVSIEEFLTVGVRRYTEESTAFFTELLENKTERAVAYRADIADKTYVEIRRRAGLTVEN